MIDWGKVITADDKLAEKQQAAYETWKREREALVSAILVMIDTKVYQGDEVAQGRMARAVAAADSLDETTEWTLNDNSVVVVPIRELKEVLRQAGLQQTAIWNEDRPAQATARNR